MIRANLRIHRLILFVTFAFAAVKARAGTDASDAFTTVSAQLVARWPVSDTELISLMSKTGLTRDGQYFTWRTTDSTGTLTVSPVSDGHFAIVIFEPARKQEMAPGFLELLSSSAQGREFGGPDEFNLKFQGKIGEGSFEDAVVFRLPRATWVKTVRMLSIAAPRH